MDDIRDVLFEQDSGSRVTACIFSDGDGVLSGVERAAAKAAELGLAVNFAASEGAALMVGDLVMELCGSPKAIAQAEDRLMGLMLKPSGIATAASRFVHAAGNMRIVCGSWKKLPYEMKPLISEAVTAGGAGARICEEPMVYLDKNYVEMLGGIQASLRAADKLEGRKKVVQQVRKRRHSPRGVLGYQRRGRHRVCRYWQALRHTQGLRGPAPGAQELEGGVRLPGREARLRGRRQL